MKGMRLAVAVMATLIMMFAPATELLADDPPVCSNRALRRAIRTINDACTDISCNFDKLKELENIDKASLLDSLRNPYLRPVHLFFPANKTRLDDAFDWRTTKKAQLDGIRLMDDPENSIVFVIGRASVTGDRDHNIKLSRARMMSVMDYVKYELRVPCHEFKGGFLGKEYLQMSLSDAGHLYINELDFRKDELILNQAVHVFVFPCKDKL